MDTPSLFDPPYQGRTVQSRHASYAGAQAAQATRSANLALLAQLWGTPTTLQQMAAQTGLPLASICSLKACLDLEPCGHETVMHAGGRTTKRTLWRLRTA